MENCTKAFAAVERALVAFRNGAMIVVSDHEHRENEGDLVVAAEKATAQHIQFMIREGGGLICIAMARDRLSRLGLSRMAPDSSGDPFRTAFMQSVDARDGISTGISAPDRARTVEVLMDDRAQPGDLVRPGHMFPLEAVEGGVLRRPGHTEAAVDMARLAGLKPAGVICEILGPDGDMTRGPALDAFARQHGLETLRISDLLLYRRNRECLVECERTVRMPTDVGDFELHMYRFLPESEHHLALVMGAPEASDAPLVRIHSECLTGDVFGSLRCDCGAQLRSAMGRIAEQGAGIVLYLRQEGRGIGLAHKLHAYALQDGGLDTVEANEHLGFEPDLRDYCAAAQMLREMNIKRVRLLTNNPLKVSGLELYGITVVERVPLVIPCSQHNERYLKTKREKLGHLLE